MSPHSPTHVLGGVGTRDVHSYRVCETSRQYIKMHGVWVHWDGELVASFKLFYLSYWGWKMCTSVTLSCLPLHRWDW